MAKIRMVGFLLGLVFLGLALLAAGAEALASLQAGDWQPRILGQVWYDLDRGSINLMQAVVQRYLHPSIWDPGMIALLQWPAWLVAIIPTAVLLFFCRPRTSNRRRSFSK